ncbi:MAG: NAD-dependent epimerase/dehydratase family protein [Chromatiales bacterium]|nr:NAD-dependent epimerase/dehydratase family protein [Chromatiales bacterium]
MTGKRPVLITGAAGQVGRQLARAWRTDYDLVLVDVRPIRRSKGARGVMADVRDTEDMRALCTGIDTVVHLAISGSLHSPREMLSPVNIDGTRSMFDAAAIAGCRRLIFASSLAIDIDIYADTNYAQAKREVETWAQEIAASTSLSIHCLRLGRVLSSRDRILWPGHPHLDHVLTHGDMIRLFTCSIEAPAAVHFGVFNGISDNDPTPHDISGSRALLGYAPQDDAHSLARRHYRSPIGLARRMKQRLRTPWT